MESLPIDIFLPQITEALHASGSLILTAPPGAGKTTRVPRSLLEAGFAEKGEILVLEPRRLATRLAAARVAQELGEKPGGAVGYSIRYENVASAKTRIRFLTEAILARQMVRNPDLRGVSVVILDEFHERNIASDLALALLKPLQTRRPDLKIVVMSATMSAEPAASFLCANRIAASGSRYDLEIEHEAKASDLPLHKKVYSAVLKLLEAKIRGDILVFLPGAAEIRRSAESLALLQERFAIAVHPLHGDLPSSEQFRAIAPAGRTKVILSTNVAETSLTIPGVAAVVDSGLARLAGHSAWSGFPTLATAKISRSSAIQRAGRAGRTQNGRAIRLYTKADFESRPEQDVPEIRRADLAETVLLLHGAGFCELNSFRWFEPPPQPAIEAAETLLRDLGAVKSDGSVTETGLEMLTLPVHPRLARLIVEGKKLKAADECALIAALLSEKDIRANFRSRLGTAKRRSGPQTSGQSDLIELLDSYRQASQACFDSERIRSLKLDAAALHSVQRAHRHFRKLLDSPSRASGPGAAEKEEAVMVAALSAFPDRVARRRKAGGREIVLCGGGAAILSRDSVVHNPEFMIAVDAEEKRESAPAMTAETIVRIASSIETEWLAALFPEAVSQKIIFSWNEQAGRVDEANVAVYRQIALEERIRPATPGDEASEILFSAILSKELQPLGDRAALNSFRARVSLAAIHFPQENFPEFNESAIHQIVKLLCRGKIALAQLASVSLIDECRAGMTDRQRVILARETPERILINPKRAVRVHYEFARPPWIESRLQDFFGMRASPAICGGKAPLTLHLLAPNGRAVQITQDIAGFWERHYPKVRRELKRRYPKHSWPEIAPVE